MVSHSYKYSPEQQAEITSSQALATADTKTERMAESDPDSDWVRIFESKASDLEEGHTWHLEFDNSTEPDNPNRGWLQYIKTTSARFKCSKCGRTWPSNKVKVVFHMQLRNGNGIVKVRRFRQNCKKCNAAPMEKPSISSDNIDILMESLVEKIRIKCYHEDLGDFNRMFKRLHVQSPHEPAHCEACIKGICTQEREKLF